ncbi:hypothetical protein IWX50DRAFT_420200 [Phyllosticta citricarpa]
MVCFDGPPAEPTKPPRRLKPGTESHHPSPGHTTAKPGPNTTRYAHPSTNPWHIAVAVSSLVGSTAGPSLGHRRGFHGPTRPAGQPTDQSRPGQRPVLPCPGLCIRPAATQIIQGCLSAPRNCSSASLTDFISDCCPNASGALDGALRGHQLCASETFESVRRADTRTWMRAFMPVLWLEERITREKRGTEKTGQQEQTTFIPHRRSPTYSLTHSLVDSDAPDQIKSNPPFLSLPPPEKPTPQPSHCLITTNPPGNYPPTPTSQGRRRRC